MTTTKKFLRKTFVVACLMAGILLLQLLAVQQLKSASSLTQELVVASAEGTLAAYSGS